MPRLRIPAALSVTLLATVSCNPSSVTPDVVAVDAPPDDVPQSCDAEPFVSYCLPTQANSGVVCRPSRACSATECSAGCTYCSFPVECHRQDGTLCLTTCSYEQCPPDCQLIA